MLVLTSLLYMYYNALLIIIITYNDLPGSLRYFESLPTCQVERYTFNSIEWYELLPVIRSKSAGLLQVILNYFDSMKEFPKCFLDFVFPFHTVTENLIFVLFVCCCSVRSVKMISNLFVWLCLKCRNTIV